MARKEKYFNDGLNKYHSGDYKGAIKDFDKVIEECNKYVEEGNYISVRNILPDAYNNRGLAKTYLGLYKEAIKDYDKAIELYKKEIQEFTYINISKIYNNKALAESYLGNYEKVIEYCENSIKYNPDFGDAYFNIGLAKYYLAKENEEDADKSDKLYKEAIEYYNKAIKYYNKDIEKYKKDNINYNNIKISLAKTYNNMGLVNYNKGNYKEAIDNYLDAIKYSDKFIIFYFNIALAYHLDGNNIEDCAYIKRLKDKLNNHYDISIMQLIIRASLFEKIKIENVIEFLEFHKDLIIEREDYFKSIVNLGKSNNNNKEIENMLYKLWIYQYILLELLYIINYGSVISNIEELSHYTSKTISEILLNYDELCNSEENRKAYLILTSISKTNDPQEGEILKNLLSINTKKNFDIEEKNKDYLVLQTSFIRYTNSLTMFRLYGKEENKEGTGISLVFNPYFFGELEFELTNPAQSLGSKEQKEYNNSGNEKNKNKLPLYFIVYYDKEKMNLFIILPIVFMKIYE